MKNDDLLGMYEGAFEQWKARLVISRIKAMGFPRREWHDLMQELAVVILEFDYDPDHAKQAKEETALYIVINNHLVSMMRSRCRERRRFERHLRRMGVRKDGTYLPGTEPCFEHDGPLRADVQRVMGELSKFDRIVAKGLARGLRRGVIARKLKCDWKTVNKATRRIKQRFDDLDIDLEALQ
ncbi:MAG: hypothetical protein WD534_01585 [Phycisphaeraceae bacterium]